MLSLKISSNYFAIFTPCFTLFCVVIDWLSAYLILVLVPAARRSTIQFRVIDVTDSLSRVSLHLTQRSNIMPNTFTYPSEVYFDELDGLGFLHHTRYLLHLERAQQKFFEQLLGVPDFNADRDEDIYVVVHGLDARFRVPLSKPGVILVDYQLSLIHI